MTNTNAGVARGVVREWIEHDLDESQHSDYVGALEPESLQERIKSALSTARSNLAREVLAEARSCDYEGILVEPMLRELFTRIGIEIV